MSIHPKILLVWLKNLEEDYTEIQKHIKDYEEKILNFEKQIKGSEEMKLFSLKEIESHKLIEANWRKRLEQIS